MEVIRFRLAYLPEQKKNLTLALGYFDGMHIGHRALLEKTVDVALGPSAILLFSSLPFKNAKSIMNLEQKLNFASRMGIDIAYVLEDDPAFFSLSPESFVTDFLLPLGVKEVVVGKDYRFGKGASGDVLFLSKAIKTHVVIDVNYLGERVSTSKIRALLSEGKINEAEELLGHAYEIMGKVVEGKHLGRTIGFPTANLDIGKNGFLPKNGIYGGFTYIAGIPYPSIINIGFNPTVGGLKEPRLESHLIGYKGNCYGRTAYVSFSMHIRQEKKFASLEELKHQLEEDKETFLDFISRD